MKKTLKQQFDQFCEERRSEESIIVKVGLKPRPLTEKLKAIYTMILCAQFVNKGESDENHSFFLEEGQVVLRNTNEVASFVSFESYEAAKQAYDILGDELILKALL